MDREGNLPTFISVTERGVVSIVKSSTAVEISTRAKHVAVSGHDNAFDAWIEGKESEYIFKLHSHGVGEGIVFTGAVERNDYHRSDGC